MSFWVFRYRIRSISGMGDSGVVPSIRKFGDRYLLNTEGNY